MLDVHVPLLPEAIQAGRDLFNDLPALPHGAINRIYDHWFVANSYQVCDGRYNIEVRLVDLPPRWVLTITHDVADNAHDVNDNAPASHTYRRNTGAIGICTTGMGGATPQNFGPYPVNRHEIEFMCAANAAVAKKYDIDTMSAMPPTPYSNGWHEHAIMTHAEAALATYSVGTNGREYAHYYCYKADGDPECRWDHATDDAQATAPDEAEAYATASSIRARSHQYKLAL